MVKTITLSGICNLITNYKVKRLSQKQEKLKYDRMYEEYIYQGLKKTEENIANGAKSYSEEEFWDEVRRRLEVDI